MFFIIAGVVLGVVLFTAITETTVFGMSCYHFGRFDINTFCLNPPIYKGGLAVAAALVVLGLALTLRKRSTPST